MKSTLRAGACVLIATACVTCAHAQSFPAKPVRVVVPYAAGGPVDTVARIVGQNLTAQWGQQVMVENRVGSGGAVGANAVAKSPPDGYTLLVTNSGPITSYPHMRKTLLFDFEKRLLRARELTLKYDLAADDRQTRFNVPDLLVGHHHHIGREHRGKTIKLFAHRHERRSIQFARGRAPRSPAHRKSDARCR